MSAENDIPCLIDPRVICPENCLLRADALDQVSQLIHTENLSVEAYVEEFKQLSPENILLYSIQQIEAFEATQTIFDCHTFARIEGEKPEGVIFSEL